MHDHWHIEALKDVLPLVSIRECITKPDIIPYIFTSLNFKNYPYLLQIRMWRKRIPFSIITSRNEAWFNDFEAVWQFLTNLHLALTNHPTIVLLGTYPPALKTTSTSKPMQKYF